MEVNSKFFEDIFGASIDSTIRVIYKLWDAVDGSPHELLSIKLLPKSIEEISKMFID